MSLNYFNPKNRLKRQLERGQKELNIKLKEIEQMYQNDTYGGQTPEETYSLFLEALKNNDINLAVKYFLPEKQEEYKTLLTQIKQSNQWNQMLKDLLNPKNSKGKMMNGNYVIEVIDDKNVSVTTIVIKKPILILGNNKTELSNLWKIAQF